jgi:hypothetical protein
MSKSAKERSLEIVQNTLDEQGTLVRSAISDYTPLQNIPVGLFFELVYSVQKAVIEEALNEKFKVRNPFGPGGE